MQDVERRQQLGTGTSANGSQAASVALDSSILARVQQLLGSRVTIATNDEDEDDDDDGYFNHYGGSGKWDRTEGWYPQIKEPTKEGLKLLMSGEFGRLRHQLKSRKRDNNIAKVALDRGTRVRPSFKEDIAAVCFFPPSAVVPLKWHKDLLPNSNGTAVAQYAANAYVGQFSSGKSN